LHALALLGMNFGFAAGVTETSGEPAVLARVRELSRTARPLIVDAGANRGDYAALVLATLPRARVVCFEPSPIAAAELRSRFADVPNVCVVELGLDRAPGRQTMFGNTAGSPLASLYPRRADHHGIEFSELAEVEVTTLDTYCAAHSINRVDLLKLDVEGGELAVLEGASALLEGAAIQAIQFEFGGTQIDSRTFIQDFWYLLSPQYRLYRVVADGMTEIPAYDETVEIFVLANYLCLRRGPTAGSRSEFSA
jgi:FkbM family methyltransferase